MPARHKGIHTDPYLDTFWPHHAVIPWPISHRSKGSGWKKWRKKKSLQNTSDR